jgi:serine/threonine protein kinase
MTPSARWARVRTLFHRALALPSEERAAYLSDQPEDDEVKGEVESLLANHREADGFLSDTPDLASADADAASEIARFPMGTRLGAFEIVGPLGTGGMGEVYRARDTRLERDVAIKVLSSSLAADPHGRERFQREARAVSRLSHPHICTLYDVGVAAVEGGDAPFLVMELLDGETLGDRLRRGPLPIGQAVSVALEILDALGAAHATGIVHRDLKPANIMLTRSGVKLVDFGLARLQDPARAGNRLSTGASDADPLTRPGLVFGTMPYMAPEQIRGGEADARSDLFAFGAVFYEMLTGRRVFTAKSEPALVAAILEDDPAPLATDASPAPPALERLVRACLAKDPDERWQHARDVALALGGFAGEDKTPTPFEQAGSPRAASRPLAHLRRWRVHAVWLAVTVALTLAAWLLASSPPAPAVPPNPQPVIVLMDSPLEGRVYDPRTLAAGGTNADDLSDALSDLPVVTYKENTSPMWHREEQVRQQHPDLIISHLSCFLDKRVAAGDPVVLGHLFTASHTRLSGLFAYLASVNPRTKFLVYSRGRLWVSGENEATWMNDVRARYPQLNGRLFFTVIPGGEKASFRDAATQQQLRSLVVQIVGLH